MSIDPTHKTGDCALKPLYNYLVLVHFGRGFVIIIMLLGWFSCQFLGSNTYVRQFHPSGLSGTCTNFLCILAVGMFRSAFLMKYIKHGKLSTTHVVDWLLFLTVGSWRVLSCKRIKMIENMKR